MKNDITTTELTRTSLSWDGVQLPDFPKGKPELTILRMTFPVGAVTGWHHHTAVNYGIVEPGLSHTYYEIIRADTSSEATIAHYKQLSIEYFSHFTNIPDPNQ